MLQAWRIQYYRRDGLSCLNVIVDKVLYPKEGQDGDWFIIATEHGICKGNIAWRPAPGERLQLTGKQSTYQGKSEFKFSLAIPDVPVNPRDQLRYVIERTRGVGPATETVIWETLGDDWKSVKSGDVPQLDKGSKLAALQEMIATVEQEAEKSQAIAWLIGYGSTVNMAISAWEMWETSTIGVVQQDCYRLAELPHYGFVHVDQKVRIHFGIADDDPRRIRACVLYSLKQLTSSGSTAIEWPVLRNEAVKNARGFSNLINEMVSEMFQDGALVGFIGTQRIALKQDYHNEQEIWNYVSA